MINENKFNEAVEKLNKEEDNIFALFAATDSHIYTSALGTVDKVSILMAEGIKLLAEQIGIGANELLMTICIAMNNNEKVEEEINE